MLSKSKPMSFFSPMVFLVLLVVGLVALAACSDDETCPTCPKDPVAFRMIANGALYGGADYANMLLYVVSDGSVERCQGICKGDPECTFFYFNARSGLNVAPLTTVKDDCAFFRGEFWYGSTSGSDTYVKQINGVDIWETAKAHWD